MNDKIYDLVIVGAGVCGLTAGLQLAEKSQNTIKILMLEATDRIGGRIRSDRLANGATIELGAQWFHGGDQNSFYRWVRSRFPKIGGYVMDTTKNRRVVWDRAKPENLFSQTHDLLEQFYQNHRLKHPEQDISFYDLARGVGTPDAMDVAQFMSQEYMAMKDAASVSGMDYFEDPNGPGGWQLKGGLSQVTNAMAQEAIERGIEIRKSRRVISVMASSVASGDVNDVLLENGEIIHTRKVLMTVSPGVLQSGAIGFEKNIKAHVEQMASSLEMANLWKVIMPLNEEFQRAVHTDERYYLVKDLHFVQGRPAGNPVVTLFAGGREARAFSAMSDEDVIRKVEKSLCRIEGLKALKGCLSIAAKSDWGTDRDFLGTYSNLLPGGTRSEPLTFEDTGLWFAGDGFTDKKTGGSLAGAFESGISAAESILRETSLPKRRAHISQGRHVLAC